MLQADEVLLRSGLALVARGLQNAETVDLERAALLMCDWLVNYATSQKANDVHGYIYSYIYDLGIRR